LKLIGENFLQLNVVLKGTNFPLIVEDKPVMSTSGMFSSIGGILSLWLGLNVMFFVEIIELFVCVIRDRFLTNRKAKPVEV